MCCVCWSARPSESLPPGRKPRRNIFDSLLRKFHDGPRRKESNAHGHTHQWRIVLKRQRTTCPGNFVFKKEHVRVGTPSLKPPSEPIISVQLSLTQKGRQMPRAAPHLRRLRTPPPSLTHQESAIFHSLPHSSFSVRTNAPCG